MKKQYPIVAALALMTALSATPALSASISIVSDGSTLAAPVATGDLSLSNGDTSGLVFGADDVGSFGTFTPVPFGAPSSTEVINIPTPAEDNSGQYIGNSGFFLVTFNLPTGYSNASISGEANADDIGTVFLNGNSLANISEFGDTPFTSIDQSFFNSGTNDFLVSDDNTGGGPSGAAFFADVTYQTSESAVPEPGTWALMLAGFTLVGAALRRRRPNTMSAACA